MNNDDVINLTKKLISIPSYVGKDNNEKNIADFIADYLLKRNFKVNKQFVVSNRYNVIATIGIPRLWFCGHMDTVEPKNIRQIKPKILKNKIYGLGAVDMKGGIAAILKAIELAEIKNNLGLLFYCDEEYSFKGMRKFLNNYKDKPSLVIVAEPTNLKISNAHRGLIELHAIVKGKSGHASRPEEGNNAITKTVEAINKLSKILEDNYSSEESGKTTCTLSSIRGGVQIGKNDNNIIYSNNTNSIPDTAEISLDIRPAKENLRGSKIKTLLKQNLILKGLKLESVAIKQDLGSLLTKKSGLKKIETILTDELGSYFYLPSQKMGYGDGQLFFEKTKSPVVYLGPSSTETCHKEDEYVDISSLKKITNIFKKIIEEYSKER